MYVLYFINMLLFNIMLITRQIRHILKQLHLRNNYIQNYAKLY